MIAFLGAERTLGRGIKMPGKSTQRRQTKELSRTVLTMVAVAAIGLAFWWVLDLTATPAETPKEADDVFQSFDQNGDGFITMQEFERTREAQLATLWLVNELVTLQQRSQRNQSGLESLTQSASFGEWSTDDAFLLGTIWGRLDANQDGFVSLAEFSGYAR